MMLMTQFGKFKLRLVFSIILAFLLSLCSMSATTTNYWLKHVENEFIRYTGLLRSCHATSCSWRHGIVGEQHSLWSLLVRLFLLFGPFANIAVVIIFIIAFVYKLNKKSKITIKLLEYSNFILISSFICMFLGFTIFISNKCNFSMWLHAISMIILIITSNMLTRTFSGIYFQNTRLAHCNKSVDTAVSNAKLSSIAQDNDKLGKSKENLDRVEENVCESKNLIEMNPIQNEAIETQAITINEVNTVQQVESSQVNA